MYEALDGRRRGQAVFTYRKQDFRPKKNAGQAYTEQELREKLKGAYSFVSRAGHGKDIEALPVEYLGTVPTKDPKRFTEVWEDSEGNCWYKTKFLVDGVLISDTEYLFGQKKRSK